ncbi:hypothetical protein AQUCO_01200091v1 [Aquilegia coerulea]|uniref:Uncharacterized protein n=1 Tax=Aquilegia coerulea TaxID=218851 RepID=A0A2G5E4H9_AQUCA|nr:hypothetical protein AQUCO_01200091v1 [Aquilegia coerulea]
MPITPKELNVSIHRSSLITPLKETERKSMFLSNMDFIVNFRIGSIFFFSKNPDFPPETVVETLETAYRKLLVTYDYAAGRLKTDEQGRLEIDCNSAGAGFIVASSELSLEDLGDLPSANPNYQKLAVTQLKGFDVNDQPLLILQITSFKCGSFSLGVTFNHMMFDGIGYRIFLDNLASLARNQPLSIVPINNRQLLSARIPPQPTFPHPELSKLNGPLKGIVLEPFLPSIHKIQSKTFHLSSSDIINLKDKAKMTDEGSNTYMVTDFNVILAHIWRCMSLATNTGNEPEKMYSLAVAYNFRHRLRPRLPSSYSGNAIYSVKPTTTCNELEVGPFSRLVQMIAQSEKQLTDEYIRSAIDYIELNKGTIIGDVFVTIVSRLGYLDTAYPWGKPMWIFPAFDNQVVNIVFVIPDIEGRSSTPSVNIVVSLQAKEMEKFQGFYDRFLGKI